MKAEAATWHVDVSGMAPEGAEAAEDRHFAIFVNSTGKQSETFVRDHIAGILPGRTVVVARRAGGADNAGSLPDLLVESGSHPGHGGVFRKLRALGGMARSGMIPDGLTPEQEDRVVATLRTRRVNVALAEFGPNGVRFARACERAGVPLYVYFHGIDATALPRRAMWRYLYGKLAARVSGIFVPSAFIAKRLQALGFPPDRLHVVPCGVAPERFAQRRDGSGTPLLVAVGRLVEKKAPHRTIAAFARAVSGGLDARLVLAGDGPLRDRCRQEIAAHGLGDRVTLRGECSHQDVAELMGRASIFVQHSVTGPDGDSEGMPVAVLEAMMSGLPVVATRHSGIPEAVLHGETGLLVSEGDVTGMGQALRRLIEDPDLARRMGGAGRARALSLYTLETSLARLRHVMGMDRWMPGGSG